MVKQYTHVGGNMSKLDDIINKVVNDIELPAPVFKIKPPRDSDLLRFELKNPILMPEKDLSGVEKMTYDFAKTSLSFSKTQGAYFIDKGCIVGSFRGQAMEHLKRHWLNMNDKAAWNRCKLSKGFERNANMDKVVDLWLDGMNYGIFTKKPDPTKEVLNKFFAKQFELLGKKS